jgi:hypothetical protein
MADVGIVDISVVQFGKVGTVIGVMDGMVPKGEGVISGISVPVPPVGGPNKSV